MKAYMVTQGEYSDYHVCGVFLKKDDAEKYISDRSGRSYAGYNDIEEIEIHEGPVKVVMIYAAHWYQGLDEIQSEDFMTDEGDYPDLTVSQRHNPRGISVLSTTRTKAVKIVSDYRAKILAEEAGIS